jgi:hypothetical protein
METESKERQETSALLDTIALLLDMPAHGLVRGQVGAVVEALDQETLLVEFSDDEGRAYAIASCPRDDLLFVRTVPRAVARSWGKEFLTPLGLIQRWPFPSGGFLHRSRLRSADDPRVASRSLAPVINTPPWRGLLPGI